MAKQKSLTEQVEELQEANERLTAYEKIFDKLCLLNFKKSAKDIKKVLAKSEENHPVYDNKTVN